MKIHKCHRNILDQETKFLEQVRVKIEEHTNDIKEEKELLIPMLKTMNNHLKILLAHWFSVGFLTLEQITWSSSCSMLQKVCSHTSNT